jgi:hypothetical protein
LRRLSPKTSIALLLLICVGASINSCSTKTTAVPVPEAKAIQAEQLWLAKVKNNTASTLLLPANNPLRSLAEMAGKISSDYRQNVMDLLRENLKTELAQKGFQVALPEEKDARFVALSTEPNTAVRVAREGNLSGVLFASEIWRWEVESQKFVRVLIDFKLIRVSDGAVVWQRRVQGAIPTPSATNVGQASTDAVKEIVRDLFGG